MATSRYPLAREDKVPFYAILRRANTGNRDRGSLAAPPLPHHRTYGSVYGGSLDYPARLRAEDAVMICLAGGIAQLRAFPRSLRRWYTHTDYVRAVEIARSTCGSPDA